MRIWVHEDEFGRDGKESGPMLARSWPGATGIPGNYAQMINEATTSELCHCTTIVNEH